MLKAGFCLEDESVPRTEYWERFITELERSAFFSDSDSSLLLPKEDTAMETNWPRYGNRDSAYVRGQPHDFSNNGPFHKYFEKIVTFARDNPTQRLLYINMHPFFRAPLLLRQHRNVVVADVSLATFERNLNPNTISMPALPIVAARSAPRGLRPIMASFQGVDSHPVRHLLGRIANRKTIIVNFVQGDHHAGKIDALNGKTDPDYEQLMVNSNFALVPRGDALFSYRFLEALSFGCVPIVISDGWILPFDRLVPWDRICLRVHTDAIPHLPQILSSLTPEDIIMRQEIVISTYRLYFLSLKTIIQGLMTEVKKI